jgi:hypothetical protein
MSYRGHVKNGTVVFDEPVDLPEGVKVEVGLADPAYDFDEFRNGLLRFAGIAEGLPDDIAGNHDHYLHGLPKK